MRTWLDAALTAFAIIFLIPSVLILASWNALPGDALYSTKTSFEKVALAITINTPLASRLSLNFTDRRFSEANRLLAKDGSTLGYTLLVAQATQSRDIVVDKQDVKQAAVLVQNIENYQKSIAEKKVALVTQPSAVVPSSVSGSAPGATVIQPTPVPTPVYTPTPITVTPPAPNEPTAVPFVPTQSAAPTAAPAAVGQPTPAVSVSVVIANLDQTNKDLEKLKEDIKREVPDQESQKHDNQGNKDNKKEDH